MDSLFTGAELSEMTALEKENSIEDDFKILLLEEQLAVNIAYFPEDVGVQDLKSSNVEVELEDYEYDV
jgi:hypothetical protein